MRRGTSVAEVPAQAIAEFVRPDGKTSLWDDGADGSRRKLVVKALLLNRESIGRMPIAALWAQSLSPDVRARIVRKDGASPVPSANRHHFELQDPRRYDYAEFALAVVDRADFEEITGEAARTLVEEAFPAREFSLDAVRSEKLRKEIKKLLIRRKRLPADS